MSYTLGEVKRLVLQKTRNYSDGGLLITAADNADYILSMVDFINDAQLALATTTKKIRKRIEIAQNMPRNLLGFGYWNEDMVHSTDDVSYTGNSARAYSFQVKGYATIYIEEETATDVWTTLETITNDPSTISASDKDGYITYKGKITAADADYRIRIRFSGDYRYLYRWVALFEENFYDDDEVPAYEPFVPYALPSDFYQINTVDWTTAERIKENYALYRFEEYENSKKRIFFRWEEKGEFGVNYYAYPTKIATDATDATTLDIPDEVIPAVISYVSSMMLSRDRPDMADRLMADFFVHANNVEQSDVFTEGRQGIVNVNNW